MTLGSRQTAATQYGSAPGQHPGSFGVTGIRFWLGAAAGTLVLAGLVLAGLYSYLLFHTAVELFSVVVAACIFVIAWNTSQFVPHGFYLVLGVAYMAVGSLDLVHTLAYKGMQIFPGYDANLPTQLWIAARATESLSLLAAPLFLRRKLKLMPPTLFYLALTTVLVTMIFARIFPDCYVEGQGQTAFKKIAEYVIAAVLLAAGGVLFLLRDRFDRPVFRLLIASILVTVIAELAFTFYVSVYGLSNLVGHLFKLVSFYLIYKAVIATSLRKPYVALFRDLKQHEQELEKALAEIKTLSGLLPICASCKRIRDDQDRWTDLEAYLEKHSQAEFTHGICPDCTRRLYPEIEDLDKTKNRE